MRKQLFTTGCESTWSNIEPDIALKILTRICRSTLMAFSHKRPNCSLSSDRTYFRLLDFFFIIRSHIRCKKKFCSFILMIDSILGSSNTFIGLTINPLDIFYKLIKEKDIKKIIFLKYSSLRVLLLKFNLYTIEFESMAINRSSEEEFF